MRLFSKLEYINPNTYFCQLLTKNNLANKKAPRGAFFSINNYFSTGFFQKLNTKAATIEPIIVARK